MVYFAVQLFIRLLLSPNLEVDDAEMVGQVGWAWGYANSHPPLYSWLVRIAWEAFHNWAAATSAPKYALLAAGYLLVYDAVRRASGSTVTAALAVASLVFIPQVIWKTQTKLSHSVLGFAATAATVHAAGMVLRDGRWRSFAWLGLAMSIGVLSKYNYLFALAGLVVAALILPEGRRAFGRPRALLSLAILLLLTAPHLLWLRSHMGEATERLYMLRTPEDHAAHGGGLPFDGLLSLGVALGLSIGTPLLAWLAAGRLFRSEGAEPGQGGDVRRLAFVVFATSIAGFALAAVFGGFHKVHERYLLALLPAFSIWLPLQWPLAGRPRAIRVLLALAGVIAVGSTVARPVMAHLTDSRLAWPYAQFAATLLPTVPQSAVVVGDRPENGANLAMNLPGARVFDGGQGPATLLAAADTAASMARMEAALGRDYEPGGRQIVCGMTTNRLRKRVCLHAEVLTLRRAAPFPSPPTSANPVVSGAPPAAAPEGSR